MNINRDLNFPNFNGEQLRPLHPKDKISAGSYKTVREITSTTGDIYMIVNRNEEQHEKTSNFGFMFIFFFMKKLDRDRLPVAKAYLFSKDQYSKEFGKHDVKMFHRYIFRYRMPKYVMINQNEKFEFYEKMSHMAFVINSFYEKGYTLLDSKPENFCYDLDDRPLSLDMGLDHQYKIPQYIPRETEHSLLYDPYYYKVASYLIMMLWIKNYGGLVFGLFSINFKRILLENNITPEEMFDCYHYFTFTSEKVIRDAVIDANIDMLQELDSDVQQIIKEVPEFETKLDVNMFGGYKSSRSTRKTRIKKRLKEKTSKRKKRVKISGGSAAAIEHSAYVDLCIKNLDNFLNPTEYFTTYNPISQGMLTLDMVNHIYTSK